jgi:hypothetical protein
LSATSGLCAESALCLCCYNPQSSIFEGSYIHLAQPTLQCGATTWNFTALFENRLGTNRQEQTRASGAVHACKPTRGLLSEIFDNDQGTVKHLRASALQAWHHGTAQRFLAVPPRHFPLHLPRTVPRRRGIQETLNRELVGSTDRTALRDTRRREERRMSQNICLTGVCICFG